MPVVESVSFRTTPNPFNPSTSIQYRLAEDSHVRISVLDLRGQIVAVLSDGHETAGAHSVMWHGKDGQGRNMATGTYLVMMNAGNEVITEKVSLMK